MCQQRIDVSYTNPDEIFESTEAQPVDENGYRWYPFEGGHQLVDVNELVNSHPGTKFKHSLKIKSSAHCDEYSNRVAIRIKHWLSHDHAVLKQGAINFKIELDDHGRVLYNESLTNETTSDFIILDAGEELILDTTLWISENLKDEIDHLDFNVEVENLQVTQAIELDGKVFDFDSERNKLKLYKQ